MHFHAKQLTWNYKYRKHNINYEIQKPEKNFYISLNIKSNFDFLSFFILLLLFYMAIK